MATADLFYEALDQLHEIDTEENTEETQQRYEIEEEDWQWLTSAVGGWQPVEEIVRFAHAEYECLKLDPDLVRAAM